MIRLCTGISENYLERASRYLDTMRQFGEGVNPTVFAVNFEPGTKPQLAGLGMIWLDYNSLKCQVPKFMLQHGGFTEYQSVLWEPDDIIIFTDADAYLQKPFDQDELDFFNALDVDDVAIGYNQRDHGQTLKHESKCVRQTVSDAEVESRFPGYAPMLCRNTGFVAATLGTWRKIYEQFQRYADAGAKYFDHYAWVQFVVCYVVQRPPFRLLTVPLHTHAHGHVGLHDGVVNEGGIWKHNGRVITYAHAL